MPSSRRNEPTRHLDLPTPARDVLSEKISGANREKTGMRIGSQSTKADVFNKITKPKPKALKKLERFGHADFLFPATKYRQRQVALSICLSPEKFLPPPLRSSAEPLHSLNVPGENHAQPEACHSIWPAATTAHLSKELIIGERR
ncbi:uncharacterized protein [Diadema antillarum]|uniref:uncharacterized protein n=1 Tax=Diadema antillarum TaxID=105358 RepID=UPI003A8353CC